MPRLIIDYPEEMPPENACYYALQVVRQGRISEAGGIAHFCWHSVFRNDVSVSVRRKRSASAADSLVIFPKPNKEQASAQAQPTNL